MQREADTVRALGMRGATAERWKGAASRGTLFSNIHYSDQNGFYSTHVEDLPHLPSVGRPRCRCMACDPGPYQLRRDAGHLDHHRSRTGADRAVDRAVVADPARLPGLEEPVGRCLPRCRRKPRAPRCPSRAPCSKCRTISVVPPGERMPTLRNLSFELPPGQALGVIGQSGSGKSTPGARPDRRLADPGRAACGWTVPRSSSMAPTIWPTMSATCRRTWPCSRARSPKTSPACSWSRIPSAWSSRRTEGAPRMTSC